MGENGEEENFSIITNSYRKSYQQIDELNDLDVEILECEQGKNGFSFDSTKQITTKRSRDHDVGVSIFCKLTIPYCSSKSTVNIQSTKDKYEFLGCILAHIKKIGYTL